MLTEFDKICDRGSVVPGFISRNLYLMITKSGGKLPLCFIMVYPNVNHALNHAASSFS